ncbi:MAG: hypothetical protein ACFHVJ_10210 [Aestuariibacter sp.]
MKKYLLVLLLGLFSASSLATNYCSSSNSIRTPPFFTVGNWFGYFHITNISDQPVTVKMEFTNTSGNPYAPTTIYYAENFSANNTPVNLQSGAVLQPGEMGEINIHDDGVRSVNVGKLSWYAESCLEEALVATLRSHNSSPLSSNLILLNDGEAF